MTIKQIICEEFEMESDDLVNLSKFRKADLETIENCMKKYAELYAKKCLIKAANEARCFTLKELSNEFDEDESTNVLKKESITNIQLPEHEI